MAKAKPQLNSISGLLGNIIISQTKGGTVLRTAPIPRKRTRSTAEQLNNERFRLARCLAQQFRVAYKLGFPSDTKRPYDLFLSHLLTDVVKTRPRVAPLENKPTRHGLYSPDASRPDLPEVYPDLDALRVSQGTLHHVTQPSLIINGAELHLTWHNNSGAFTASADDIVYLVIYDPIHQAASTHQAHRSDAKITLTLPCHYAAPTTRYYLGCTNSSLTLAANSIQLFPKTK